MAFAKSRNQGLEGMFELRSERQVCELCDEGAEEHSRQRSQRRGKHDK